MLVNEYSQEKNPEKFQVLLRYVKRNLQSQIICNLATPLPPIVPDHSLTSTAKFNTQTYSIVYITCSEQEFFLWRHESNF